MTRKHFTLIAETISDADLSRPARATLAQDFAERLAAENPRFDRDKFFTACGL